MAISLTHEAAQHVSRQLSSRGRGEGIRIAVKTSGCSGLAYVLEFVDQAEPEDTAFRVRWGQSVCRSQKPRLPRRDGGGFRERGAQRGPRVS